MKESQSRTNGQSTKTDSSISSTHTKTNVKSSTIDDVNDCRNTKETLEYPSCSFESSLLSEMNPSSGSSSSSSSSSDTDDHNSNGSSAAAGGGAVRGVFRSLASRFAAGRLPVKAPPKIRPSIRSSLPRPKIVSKPLFQKRLSVKHVAHVSDRISTGLEVLSSAQEVSSTVSSTRTTPESTTTTTNTRWPWFTVTDWTWTRRAFLFAGNLTKNTILGAAVFESYGYIVSQLAVNSITDKTNKHNNNNNNNSQTHPNIDSETDRNQIINHTTNDNHPSTTTVPYRSTSVDVVILDEEHVTQKTLSPQPSHFGAASTLDDDYSRASVPSHFVAGFGAGTVHGVLSVITDPWTSEVALSHQPTSSFSSIYKKVMETASYFRSSSLMVLHHAIAHSLLFGSYEMIKRILLVQVNRTFVMTPTTTVVNDNYVKNDEVDSRFHFFLSTQQHLYHHYQLKDYHDAGGYLVSFGVAGGLAGQIQHIASHYTEPIALQLSQPTVAELASPTMIRNQLPQILRSVPRPTFQSTMSAFLPSAIGFIAFEYGKMIISTVEQQS